eukprot:jgi/Chrpa1/1775/Chrysochromulina_OHIO_Genome00011379-RA
MPFAAMRIYGVGLAFVITHSMAATPMCEPWCSNSCADLTGNVAYECGGCAVTEPGCRPGAAGWPDESSGVVRPAAETDDDGWPGVVRPAAETGEGPRLSPTTAGEGLGPAQMESLWPTTIYMAMQPEMETHNEELAALIEARFVRLESQLQRKGRSKDESLFDADDDLNALFHDQHRYGLSDAMKSARQCLREKAHIRPWQHIDRKAVEACEAEAAANSIWPELMNSTAFRSLFGHERGHIWRHLRRYAALLTGSHREGQWDATFAWDMTSDLDVRTPEDAGVLQVFDPRHIELETLPVTQRRVTSTVHTIVPQPGRLVICPAYAQHEVQPTRGHSPRISLAFDVNMNSYRGRGAAGGPRPKLGSTHKEHQEGYPKLWPMRFPPIEETPRPPKLVTMAPHGLAARDDAQDDAPRTVTVAANGSAS